MRQRHPHWVQRRTGEERHRKAAHHCAKNLSKIEWTRHLILYLLIGGTVGGSTLILGKQPAVNVRSNINGCDLIQASGRSSPIQVAFVQKECSHRILSPRSPPCGRLSSLPACLSGSSIRALSCCRRPHRILYRALCGDDSTKIWGFSF